MQQKRIDSLQVLRAFACLAVLFLHCDVGGDGAFGVSIFIVLSVFASSRGVEEKIFKIEIGAKLQILFYERLYAISFLRYGIKIRIIEMQKLISLAC